MAIEPIKILILHESSEKRTYLSSLVRVMGYDVLAVSKPDQFVAALNHHDPQVLLLGPDEQPGLIDMVRQHRVHLPILCLKDKDSAPKAGMDNAINFDLFSLPGNFDYEDLRQAIGQLLAITKEPVYDSLSKVIIGETPGMVKVKNNILRICTADITVLVTGESGTGKEMVARAIHRLSKRSARAFIKVNSAALPTNLLESELFGYEKGAFTGAIQKKPGKFELAHLGTILLDEIGEIPLSMQAKLLQVLQDSEYSSLGSTTSTRIDARVIAATNAELDRMVANGKFRPDLFYRLNVVAIHLPALRDRREDIPLLLAHFLRKYAARYGREYKPISERTRSIVCQYSWPGNVRQLENFVRGVTVLGDEESLCKKLLDANEPTGNTGRREVAADATAMTGTKTYVAPSAVYSLKDMRKKVAEQAESDAILKVLQHTRWNRRKASDILEISYKALLNKIREYGLGNE